jgi:hypothetical protein
VKFTATTPIAEVRRKEERFAREFYTDVLAVRRAVWAYTADPDETRCPF